MALEHKNANRVATNRRHFDSGCAGKDHSWRRQHHASRGGNGTSGERAQTYSSELAGSGIRGQRRPGRTGEDAYDAPERGWPAEDGKCKSTSARVVEAYELAQSVRRSQGRGQRRAIV